MTRWLMVLLCCWAGWLQAAQGPSLNEAEYKQLQAVHALMEQADWQAARQQLQALAGSLRRPYANALRLQSLGQVELQLENYPQALKALRAAYQLQALPAEQQLRLLHLRAQLQLQQQHWRNGIELLELWLKQAGEQAPQTIRADDYLWLAQAYSQLEQWRHTVRHIRSALRRTPDAPESWHQLELAGLLQLKDWPGALVVLRRLVRMVPEKETYWSQIASLQLQLKRNREALATLRIAYEQGYLAGGGNQRLLAQLMLQQQMPFQAAQVLEKALAGKRLKDSARNRKLLANAWGLAREHQQALEQLQVLARQTPDADLLTRIARLQIDRQQWREADRSLQQALQLKPKQPERLLLLQGIARLRMEQLDGARHSFHEAQQFADTRSLANSWLQYLEQIEG
ncbi:hypothetical protein [Marinobacterium arenosum]|uniref:hypothetical protein n=1 Tax=Marinobacterium arenosum TaxID=2862496 RepID=UPI001C98A4A5|nr:hypothetical protein [Marinobacterium arenosum]MBY4678250.1 hypothetical protein [Marinobacterium arenosum]